MILYMILNMQIDIDSVRSNFPQRKPPLGTLGAEQTSFRNLSQEAWCDQLPRHLPSAS